MHSGISSSPNFKCSVQTCVLDNAGNSVRIENYLTAGGKLTAHPCASCTDYSAHIQVMSGWLNPARLKTNTLTRKCFVKAALYTMIRCCAVSPLLSYSVTSTAGIRPWTLEVMRGDMRQTVHVDV